MPSYPDITTDVLIVGGGPVGLVLAYSLRRFSLHPAPDTSPLNPNPISVHIIEKHPKPTQQTFGRAVTFWPRSMEILDQLGLADDIMQQCVAVRESSAYDKDGNEVFGRGWSFVEQIAKDGDTRFGFASVLRQKFVEGILRRRLAELGVRVNGEEFDESEVGHEFVGLEVDQGVPIGEDRVRSTVKVTRNGEVVGEYTVRSKYVIGCDGSRTVVRDAAGIASVGSRTEDKWVRIDGVLKSTTHPKPRTYGALESPIYGNVLWIPLDHGATRLGYALNEERMKQYDELNEDAYIAEAKLSVKPFEIEYERIDWASIYSVGQRVAKSFSAHGCIFLAGDACHTHSSGAGQGMNAGMHDASNLGWKLALVLKGLAKPELLDTYDAERRPNAEKLIKYDEDISVLVSGRLPSGWTGDPRVDPHLALGTILQEAKGFNTGLGINYGPGLLTETATSMNGLRMNGIKEDFTKPARAKPGYRAPDIELLRPAMWDSVWLQRLTSNMAKFQVIVFVGSKNNYQAFRDLKSAFATGDGVTNKHSSQTSNGSGKDILRGPLVRYTTILPEKPPNPFMELDCDPLGDVYYDENGKGHSRYEIGGQGAVLVIRPDGWISLRIENLQAPERVRQQLQEFLGRFLI